MYKRGESMKKIISLFTLLFILNGCVESMALLGPASTVVGGGNVINSSISSAASYGIKKQTGKSPMEHAASYMKENNPAKKKETCVSFIESTNSEICAVAKKRFTELQKSIKNKSKIKSLD